MSKILNFIFSTKNEYKNNTYRKNITLFGLKFSLKLRRRVLLICRFDGIGDYILLRKFFKNIRNSEKYKNYKIIFAGRNEFAKFSEKYDRDYIDEFIWIPYSEFVNSYKIRRRYLNKFSKLRVDDVISPVYDREFDICEKVINSVKAKNIYGHQGPLFRLKSALSDKQIQKYNKNYTKFINTGDNIIFEQERYRLFLEQVLEEKIPQNNEFIKSPIDLRKEFILIGPFSGDKIRTWDKKNFIKLINYITDNLKYAVGILGGSYEKYAVDELIAKVNNDNVINLAGKIEISELPIYLNYAKLLITNETGTVHIAKLTGTNTICISNGSYMDRFQPYQDQNNIFYIYPDNIKEYLENHKDEKGQKCKCDINSITPNSVISLMNKIL